MASDRLLVGFKCRRDVWFKWSSLCRSHGVLVQDATETLIAEKLKELGIKIEADEAAVKVEGPGPMVRP